MWLKKRSAYVIRTKILFSSKIRSVKVIMTKNRSFQIILDPIQNRSAERFVQFEVVQFEALLYFNVRPESTCLNNVFYFCRMIFALDQRVMVHVIQRKFNYILMPNLLFNSL